MSERGEDLRLVLLHEIAIRAERDDPCSKHRLAHGAQLSATGGREAVDLLKLERGDLGGFVDGRLRLPQRVQLSPFTFLKRAKCSSSQ